MTATATLALPGATQPRNLLLSTAEAMGEPPSDLVMYQFALRFVTKARACCSAESPPSWACGPAMRPADDEPGYDGPANGGGVEA